MELKTLQRVVKMQYQCDVCHIGTLHSTGVALMSNPAQYPHKCDRCDNQQIFRVRYPLIRHEDAE